MADSEPSSSEIKFEETSPDALKNTPSNIAKLEDIIEQCEGRRKYLAGTKSPSDGEDVRWYFCKVPLIENQLAASVPQMEIVGKSEYFRFGMRDSLALEASFLQREEELLSAWWKEYAECSDGPSGSYVGSVHSSDVTLQPYSSEGDWSNKIYAIEEERVGVPVKGGLYEVDLTKRHCFPIYWHGENRRVLRGHWFARKAGIEWLPLREDVAEQLEFAYRCQIWHRRTFQPSGLFAARIDLQGSRQGLHALFTGEDDTWEAWLGVDNSGFSSITWRGNGTKLRRGFASSGSLKPTQDELRQQKEEETDDYCSQVPVRHLVFMVHGIGQRLEKANLVDDVATFRNITANLAERHLTPHQRETQRVLFIPCQWRRGLKLGGESAVEKITLDGVRGLRVTLSATVHDVLYYMSPIYCQEIINSVSNQLNRLYLKFIKRNPGYDGKVSIYGHSLGSVLSYDILCHQESLPSPFSMQNLYNGCVGAGNSVVEEDDQSTVPGSATDLGRENVSRNMEDSEFLAASVGERDNLSPQRDGDESTRFISAAIDPFPISHIESDSSKLGSSPNQADNSGSSFNKNGNMSSDKEESRELDLDSSDLFSQQENGLGAGQNIISQIPDYAMNKMEKDTSGNVGEKVKLICLLREEVESLKARIAELESRQSNSLILSHCVEDSGQEAQQGEEVDKDASNRSFLQKTSSEQDGSRKTYTPYITYTKLEFKVDTFFAVGSPLGVFLALRNIRIGIGEGQEYWQDERISEEMPACRKMFNIFHPFDPVAYRVEPLVSKEYINKRPVIIPYHKGGKRLHIGLQDFTEDLAARSQAVMNRLNSMKVQVVNVLSRNKDKKQEAIEDVQDTETRTYGSIMMERLTGSDDGRIDHMLQDATFEHAYISAIGSHTSYWRDYDTALFILRHLYHDIPEEPDTFEPLSEKRRILGVQSCQSEVMGEELPLTFSDKVLVREFSRKAKKVMKNT